MNEKTLGQVNFEGYDNHGPSAGKTFDGRPVPPWGELSDVTRKRWEAGAQRVVRERFGATVDAADSTLRGAFDRALKRYDDLCMMHNGPHTLLALFEFFEQETSIGIPFPPPTKPPEK